MATKKLFYNDHRYYGQELSAPVDGVILIDEEGFVEVSEPCAAALLGIPGWEDPVQKKQDAVVETKLKNKEKAKQTNPEWLEGIDLNDLSTLTVDELKELAVAGDIKNYDKFLKNQPAMAKYIKNQLSKLNK